VSTPKLPDPEVFRLEFSREVDVRQVEGKHMQLVASAAECAALARRFALVRIDRLEAELTMSRVENGAEGRGHLKADIVQSCAVSGEPLPVKIDEPLLFRFVAADESQHPGEEVEIALGDCDEIEFTGSVIDPGEAVAQSLALAIDPFAIGPNAEKVRRRAGLLGEGAAGPFAALAALKTK
jgi:uncharacterized metal-binding protein YceD (DUF177 family)